MTPTPSACLDEDPETTPPSPTASSTSTPINFNGSFDDRAFPYTGACSCTDADSNPTTQAIISCSPALTNGACYCDNHDGNPDTAEVVRCATPFEPSAGWVVQTPGYFTLDVSNPTDTRLHPTGRGHGGVFFLYGAGFNAGTPRAPGYGVPDGTALYFQTCDNSDRWNNVIGVPRLPNDPLYQPSLPDGIPDTDWCFQSAQIVVSSNPFSVTAATNYALSGWFYSTTTLSVGTSHDNQLQFQVRFYDAAWAQVGFANVAAPAAAPTPIDATNKPIWQPLSIGTQSPSSAVHAQVDVIVGRNRQSNVYVDDLALTPLP